MQHNSGLSSQPGASWECICSKYIVRTVGWTFIPASSSRAVLPSLWNAPHTHLVLSFLSTNTQNGRLPAKLCINGYLWTVGCWESWQEMLISTMPVLEQHSKCTHTESCQAINDHAQEHAPNHFNQGLIFKFLHTATFYGTCPSLNCIFLYVKYKQF